MNQQGRGGGQELETALDTIGHKVHDLRRQLRRAVVDHVSDTFLDTSGPLAILITAALAGREAEVDEASLVFSQHAAKLVEVASLACSMSSNEEGIYLPDICLLSFSDVKFLKHLCLNFFSSLQKDKSLTKRKCSVYIFVSLQNIY